MFCVKCGKDAGQFRFCPHCGTQVPEIEEPVWSVGMACPHCGGTKLEGNCCAFCGAQLIVGEEENDQRLFTMRVYKGLAGEWISVEPHRVVIGFRWLCLKKVHEIPYEDIQHLRFVRAHGDKYGYLLIRWKGDGGAPFPVKSNDYSKQPGGILFDKKKIDEFYQVFCYLKKRTEAHAGACVLELE